MRDLETQRKRGEEKRMIEELETMIRDGWLRWKKRQKDAGLKKKDGIWIDPSTKRPKVVP